MACRLSSRRHFHSRCRDCPRLHPCRRRLNRIAAALDEIWRDPKLIAQLRTTADYQGLLKKHFREPLVCPNTGAPYQFFPESGVVLADSQPHGIGKSQLAIEWQHTPSREHFRVIGWSPSAVVSPSPSPQPMPSFFQAFFDFLRGLIRWFNPNIHPFPTDCMSNLKNVSLALLQYIQDYDERFPPMKVTAETQAVLMPYIRNIDMFSCPTTKQPYHPNLHLHLKRLIDIYQPANTPSFYDALFHPDGTHGVAYVDGHARFVTPLQWQVLQQGYRLPPPP